MTLAELERRVREIFRASVDHEVKSGRHHVLVPLRSMWAEGRGDTLETACDAAWARIIVCLCDDVAQARKALDAARAFDER